MYLLTIHPTATRQRLQNGVLKAIMRFYRLALPEVFRGGCLCRRSAGTAIPTARSRLRRPENEAILRIDTAAGKGMARGRFKAGTGNRDMMGGEKKCPRGGGEGAEKRIQAAGN